jgi:NADPH:quinone reductase-like Zn-dependent oxidoreductase
MPFYRWGRLSLLPDPRPLADPDGGLGHCRFRRCSEERRCQSAARKEDLEELHELLEAGKVTPVVDRTLPLIDVPEAIRYLREGRARGKIVITV